MQHLKFASSKQYLYTDLNLKLDRSNNATPKIC
jgi:hypothetical protein